MTAFNTADTCLTREIFTRVGDRWSMYVIVSLGSGTHRFGELRRAVDGISERMLSVTLRSLERDGLVHRQSYPEVPPRVEYSLTAAGQSLLSVLAPLLDWCQDHTAQIDNSRFAYDTNASRPR